MSTWIYDIVSSFIAHVLFNFMHKLYPNKNMRILMESLKLHGKDTRDIFYFLRDHRIIRESIAKACRIECACSRDDSVPTAESFSSLHVEARRDLFKQHSETEEESALVGSLTRRKSQCRKMARTNRSQTLSTMSTLRDASSRKGERMSKEFRPFWIIVTAKINPLANRRVFFRALRERSERRSDLRFRR